MMHYPLQTLAEADNFQRRENALQAGKQILNGSKVALGGYYFNFSQTSVKKVTLPVGNHARPKYPRCPNEP
jgi:hypothetical protein